MLIPDISWREQYASAALNRKFFGIIPVGVYRGFNVTENGDGTITVDTTNSTAVVESNGYSLTVTGDGTPETFTIPDGDWKLVIRATYTVGGATAAEMAVVEAANPGEAVVATARKEPQSDNVTLITEPPATIVTEANNPSTRLDFGELSIDLGEADQHNGGQQVDFGEM